MRPIFSRKYTYGVDSSEIFTKRRLLFAQKHAIISANAEITERFAEMRRFFQNGAEKTFQKRRSSIVER